ncbi:MAG: hypothetical protein WCL18_03055 [bacterium]
MKQVVIEQETRYKKPDVQETKKEKKMPQTSSYKHQAKVGEFISVKITKAVPFKLYGEIN